MKIDKRDFPLVFDEHILLRKYGVEFSNGEPEEGEIYAESALNKAMSNKMFISSKIMDNFPKDDKGHNKIMSLRKDIKPCLRCVMYKDAFGYVTMIYNITGIINGSSHIQCLAQSTKRGGFHPITNHFIGRYDNSMRDGEFELLRTKYFDGEVTDRNATEYCSGEINIILFIELFLQFAKIETKYLKPNSKDSILCKYNNKTPFPITVVDSTWYTNLVKSDAFKVSGHFRLQPHGHGLKDKKLIWINEFQKEGYTREAKMLSLQ